MSLFINLFVVFLMIYLEISCLMYDKYFIGFVNDIFISRNSVIKEKKVYKLR